MNNPEYIKINDKKYKINTNYKVAIECNEIISDTTIGNYERALAIIYLLFGDEGLDDSENYEKLLELGVKYLTCNQDIEENITEEPDMNFTQDMWLIEASFKSDYGISLKDENMHWWDFYKYINGLTDKCVLNRVRELRIYDTSKVKDIKEKEKIQAQQKRFALKKKAKTFTNEEKKSIDEFYKKLGINREE